jgi:hypothetical protein
MGRTIPSWRIIVEQKLAELTRFHQFLPPEDRVIFDDLLNQCKLYAPQGRGPRLTRRGSASARIHGLCAAQENNRTRKSA